MKRELFVLFAAVTLFSCVCTNIPVTPVCTEPGTIGLDRVPNPTQGFEVSFQYYLPLCYEKEKNTHFPVIYLITMPFESRLDPHGHLPMSLADRLMRENQIPPVIIIIPNDTIGQGYHTALAIDLIPYVDKEYKTFPARRYRSVGGISHR